MLNDSIRNVYVTEGDGVCLKIFKRVYQQQPRHSFTVNVGLLTTHEQGLLGLALRLEFDSNGFFYVDRLPEI